jgi:hypothetical protein
MQVAGIRRAEAGVSVRSLLKRPGTHRSWFLVAAVTSIRNYVGVSDRNTLNVHAEDAAADRRGGVLAWDRVRALKLKGLFEPLRSVRNG